MQYLSQRLASKPAKPPGATPASDSLGADQRRRILDAVEQLVGERGCGGASIEAIVKAAGVSSVTFYEFFDSKEECFVAAFDRAVEAAAAEMRDAAQGMSWPEQVATGLRSLLARIEAEPARARLCLVETQTGGQELSARFEAMLDRVAAKLREGRALDTALPSLPATQEEATAGGLTWLLRERLERDDDEGVEALYPKLVEIALGPYLGDG